MGSDWNKTALLVVDMQNDFLDPGHPFCVAGGLAIVPMVQKAVDIAREKGAMVIWVIREHDSSGRDAEYFRKKLYEDGKGGAVKGTHGAHLVDGLSPQPGEPILVKYRFSAFFQTNLNLILRRAQISTVAVAGVQTPNCIRATVFDAVAHDYPSVVVLSDATAAATPDIHEANLRDFRNVGVSTLTVAAWSVE